MRKSHLYILGLCLSLLCISWGTVGHFSVALIAEKHLTTKAQTAVKDLLGNETMSEASTWADDVRGEQEYKSTGPRHYINLPLGLNYETFGQKVRSMSEDNVYKAVLKCEQDLKSASTSRTQKTEALKFLIHFIGDLHQPMHVSRAEDKGGNTILVKYKGDATNLHTVWDSKLIDNQELNYKEIAAQFDTASTQQIAHWQNDSLIQWLWESYQISSALYSEIDGTEGHNLKKAYYKRHIGIVDQRLEMAGVRLAGILNEVFNDNYQPPAKGTTTTEEVAKQVKIEDAGKHIGEYATICSKIYGHKDMGEMTLVNLGNSYPNHLLTVVLKGEALATFKKIDGKEVCVTGKIIDYKGKPEIIVTNPKKFEFSEGK